MSEQLELSTSQQAYKSIKPHLGRIQKLIVQLLKMKPLTCEELEDALRMKHQTVSARIFELNKKGVIEPSGNRRYTKSGRLATVWKMI